jgi:hypothetical protein
VCGGALISDRIVKTISLQNSALVVQVDDADYAALAGLKWWVLQGYATHHGRQMHRVIVQPGDDQVVDHADGNSLNNQRSNLRVCSVTENLWNRRRSWATSGYKGVWQLRSGNWGARITKHGRIIHLGTFPVATEAALAYDAAALKLFGKFAATNHALGLLPAGEARL